MKKYIKLILFPLFIIIIFFISRKITLNNYLDKTDEISKKINYSTNINLNIKDSNNNSKIEYEVVRSSNVKKITLFNYSNDKIVNDIKKYIVEKGSKKGSYIYDGKKYKKSDNIEEEFLIDYKEIKDKIKSIKKVDNVIINNKKYKKYIVKMKSYDAYNLIYKDEILKKDDSNKDIEVEIYIDKSNNFIYKIKYEINDLNNSDDSNSLDYNVEIVNKDINNTSDIKLPF